METNVTRTFTSSFYDPHVHEEQLINALQYLVVLLTGFAVICTPYMLVLSVRRKQKMRAFDIIAYDLMLIYVALDIAFPSAATSMPRFMHWSYLIVLLA